jgi:Spy/CpxP family protein refolding chaperone
MKRIQPGTAFVVAALAAFTLLGNVDAARAQPGGYGPGQGMGPGMMSPGQGMGPGMMGPGMMGPGMMGPGMMGPGYGMGPGMMGGYGSYYGLDLSSEQREKIAAVQEQFARKRWDLMYRMHEADWRMHDVYRDGKLDEQAARKAYDAMAGARKQMFDAWLEAQKRTDAVLTAEQREKLRGYRAR